MSNQTNGRKISQFLSQSSIPSDAQITYISGGVNYRITLTDFLSSIGVTGTIVQDGAVTGTPVLDAAGAINNIRNIEDGPGIKSSVSAENGIDLEHNFQADQTGVPIVDDLTLASPKFSSLVAGSGINIAATNGEIQVSLSATPVSTKTIIVNDINDFPAAIGGTINLADDTEYAVRNDITTSSDFAMGNNCVISGSESRVVAITYTGTGTMFTSSNKSWTIKNISITCATGTFLVVTGTGTQIFQILSVVITADTLGALSDFAGGHFDDVQQIITTDGFTFSGINGVILFEANQTRSAAGTVNDLGTATFNAISITDAFATLNGTSIFSGRRCKLSKYHGWKFRNSP